MRNIDRIITEAINQNVLFPSLKGHSNVLKSYNTKLQALCNNQSNTVEINTFLRELYNFTYQLAMALDRCVTAQNLNESFDSTMSNLGLPTVPIVTRPFQAFGRAFKNTDLMQSVRNMRDRWNGKDYQQGQMQRNGQIIIPQNAKLEVLLTQYYPLIQQKYMKLDRKYNGAVKNMTPIQYMFDEFEQIIAEIRNTR